MVSNETASRVGVLPWRLSKTKEVRVMLVTRPADEGWTIPVGDQIEGTTSQQTASRMAYRAAGVTGDVGRDAIGDYEYWEPADNAVNRLCVISLFGLHVRGTLAPWPEHKKWRRRWFSIEEAASKTKIRALADFLSGRFSLPGLSQ
nr:NUDIX domain-containing protein [Rhizobium setariae]